MSGAAESLVHEDLSQALLAATPPELVDFSTAPVEAAATANADQHVRIELGRTSLDADKAARLAGGSVVQLDELAHDPVSIYADGSLVARGEILVLDSRLCVRITELAET
jgi:flagellar motor switch protein FliN/FliY